MSVYTVGYYIVFILLANIFYWLVSTNSWTPGKKAVTTLVGMLTWNYLWACINLTFLNNASLDTLNAFMWQGTNLIGAIYVNYLMRKGANGSNNKSNH